MFIERIDEDTWIRCMPVWVVDTLIRLPEWLETDAPNVKERLLPKAYADEAAEREWRRHITPELEYLFQSRTQILRKDLAELEIDPPDGSAEELDAEEVDAEEVDAEEVDDEEVELVQGDGITFTLKIPGKHLSAWVTGLQAGTHAVFLVEDLNDQDIGKDPRHEADPHKQLAMMRVLIMQELLSMLCTD